MSGFDEFVDALTAEADVVIEDVGPRRALSISEALAVRGWFDARRTREREALAPKVPEDQADAAFPVEKGET